MGAGACLDLAGNLAEHLSRRLGDADLWSELIGIRNVYAHYTPGAIDYDRVWFDASTDIDRVLVEAHSIRDRLGHLAWAITLSSPRR